MWKLALAKEVKLGPGLLLRPNCLLELYWSQVSLAFSSLKQGLDSQAEIEVSPWPWEHRILTTTPIVSDKALTFQLYRKEFPRRQKVVKKKKKIKYLLGGKKSIVHLVDTGADSERERCPLGSLNHLHRAFLLGYLCPIILICKVLWVCIVKDI